MVDPDGSASPPPLKKLKCPGESNPFETEDGISNLPDTVLCSILSCLPTKEAVRSSILSKRWKYQWTSLPHITLNDSPLDPCKKGDQYETQMRRFLNFVDGVIFRHDASNIEKFCLSFTIPIKQSRVNAWISAVISRKVRELELTLSYHTTYVFQFSLFTFETLTNLHLEKCSLKISIAIRFQSLKTCRLVGVTFLEDLFTQCLFPDCPVLENLVLDYCIWPKWAIFIIAVPSLKSFKLHFDDLYIITKIYAPNLENLELSGSFVYSDWVFSDLHSLVNVSIDYLIQGSTDNKKAERVIQLFKAIQAVKSLQIHDSILGKITLIEHLKLGNSIPIFHHLTHLEVLFDDCFTCGADIMRILLRSPKLESLSIDASRQSEWFWLDDDWMNYSVPGTSKLALKEVSLDGFHGNVAEIHLLELLLQHSLSLERVDILCVKNLLENPKKIEEVNNLIQMLPRVSSRCVIKLQ